MHDLKANRFQKNFEEIEYVHLKNYLYNYRMRKIAFEKKFQHEKPKLILECGSGISPVIARTDRIVYLDLSFTALKILKRTHSKGCYVAGDAAHLPFKSAVFSHAVSSEVLEHLEDDQKAIKELARVMYPSGRLVVSFPHRKFYFAYDDRFVNHLRRYEVFEMEDRLKAAGFKLLRIQKVLGPLDKITMCFATFCFSLIQKFKPQVKRRSSNFRLMKVFAFFFNWANLLYMVPAMLDAIIIPRAFATVLLIDSTLSDSHH